jgi:phosphate transport system permease protein
MATLALPTTALLFGFIWSRTPMSIRSIIRPGYEFIWFAPILITSIIFAWNLGPPIESILFSVNGHGDFPQWWRNSTGLPFEQRNSLVVGIMMGFAVIPIIFTIAEDALSNVPPALRSASLALGASRWQTALRVVLPTASAGIFSALMIGFGRAIGETMIVVMATGNTPILGLNIFDGMRTLSANIAVELPEAPQHSTLYRTLFFGALLLFMLTFVVNTAAELLRQHLREKYKTV